MSMISVPSLAPGARTLPAGLRDDYGNHDGWQRLHGNMAPLTEPPAHIPVDIRVPMPPIYADEQGNWQHEQRGVSGLGYYDAGGTWIPDETPYPVVFSDPAPYTPPVDWASIIASGTHSLADILAITQGGSVTPQGVYGSPQTATVAAGTYPAGQLNIGGGGISGILSSPMILLLIGGGILFAMAKK
jgi:hypothetical protein